MSEAVAEIPDEESVEDLEPIVPSVENVTIAGVPCRIRRLKTREFLALVNVLTSGLGASLQEVSIDFTDEESIGSDLSALMLLAIPNAVDEFAMFLRAVVEPKDEKDAAKVATYLIDNPDVDDLLLIFEAIVTQEKDDLAVLAGKAQAMWKRIATLYSKKKPTAKKSTGRGGRSRARST
jgi:hypothetical protein